MTLLDAAPEILDLAAQLGVSAAAPVDGILDFCRSRIDRWVAEARGVTTISQLEDLVTLRLQMVFEEIRSDDDFSRITDKYARGKRDFVFAAMRSKFDDAGNPTYGTLVRRNVGDDAPDRFVAVIDCRGSKLARRFFTRWHEIAHRLTTHADEGSREPAYRSEHDPIERMMDEIAGHVGFYEPFFEPVFGAAHAGKALLTFETVKAVLDGGFPEASFQATLNACAKRLPTPVLYLEAMLAHKKAVRRRLATPSLFGDEPPPGELRAVKLIPNDAAQEDGFMIPTNMRVPEASVIHRMFLDETAGDGSGREDLSWWESQARKLERRAIAVEARRVADRVIAIVQPVEPVRQQRKETNAHSLFAV
ncbi:MAG TPA: hypothetical protein VH592_10280 [Gemmataceae bacterium]|jgi:hypothetical protein